MTAAAGSGAAAWQALQVFGRARNAVARYLGRASPTAVAALEDSASALAALASGTPALALGLAAVRPDEDDLAHHSVRAGLLAAVLGHEVGQGPASLVDLLRLALVHEAGTARLPEGLVHRAGTLDPAEHRIVSRAASLAVARVLEEGGFDRVAGLRLAGLDGLRAPGALVRRDERGEVEAFGDVPRPPVHSRLLAIACAYDALTSTRPYRDAFAPREALAVMWTELAGRFDPSLLGVFQGILRVGPVRVRSSRPKETPVLDAVAPEATAAAPVASISIAGHFTEEFVLDGEDGVELADAAGEPLVVELGGGADGDDEAEGEAWIVVDD